MRRRLRAGLLLPIVFAALLPMASVDPVAGQEAGTGDLDAEDCSNGTFVTDPQSNPDLVTDCRALVAIRNHWFSHPDNVDVIEYHPIAEWGSRRLNMPQALSEKDISGWSGLTVADGKLLEMAFTCNSFDLPDCQDMVSLRLSGTIPQEIGNFTNIEVLDLQFNSFYGPLPAAIGQLTSLRKLYISGTSPSGSIPREIGNLINLEYLRLGGEMFSGSIPVEIGNLVNLYTLEIWGQNISGQIPKQLGNLIKLTHLQIADTKITGLIPPEIENLENLRNLYLYENKLNGLVPQEIANLKNLNHLYLHNNELDGKIPSAMGNLSELELLYLEYNNFDGAIPKELGNLNNLETLLLNNNNLSGSVPKELGQMSALGSLHIENNFLSGRLPEELGQLDLYSFYFCGNDFEEPVPEGLRNINNSPNYRTGPAAVIDSETGSFFCPETWRVMSAEKTAKTSSAVLDALGHPVWAWNAQNQIWSHLEPTGAILPEGTAIVYRSPVVEEYTLRTLGLSNTDSSISLALHYGWNILSAPTDLQRPQQSNGVWFIHSSLIDCNGTPEGVIAVIRYHNISGHSLEMPCHPDRESRLTTAGYSPLDRIETGDFVYIYFRSLLPVNIRWDSANRTYKPATN